MTGILLIMLAATLWAADTLIRYPLLETNSTLQIVFYEHLLLVIVLAGILLLNRRTKFPFKKEAVIPFLFIGVLGSALGTLAFTKAFTMMNPTLVILLQKLQPVVAISMAAFILGEPLRKRFALWALVSLSGSILMIAPDIKALLQTSQWFYDPALKNIALATGSALVAVFVWGSSTVFGRKLTLLGYKSHQIMSGRFSLGFITLLFLMVIYQENFLLSAGSLPKLSLMVAMSGLLGMWLYYQGLKRIPARYGTIGELFFPVAAVMINWLLLDIPLTWQQAVGGAVLILGSIMVTREPRIELKQPTDEPAIDSESVALK
ncbi:DMT family transporter [Reinekea sp.]|uniref:DMT family transporter n=1 Tax=Reinekea sp. TaxID=1970455 RepID=UPI0039893445